MQMSKSLAKALLTQLRGSFGSGELALYAGAVPADADAALAGATLLASFLSQGNATIVLGAPTDNTIAMAANDVWKCLNPVASGTATFFRFKVYQYDTGGAQDSEGFVRVQGTVGKSGTDLLMADPVIVAGTAREIKYFSFTLPLKN